MTRMMVAVVWLPSEQRYNDSVNDDSSSFSFSVMQDVTPDEPTPGRCNASLVTGLPCQNEVIGRSDVLCAYHLRHDPIDHVRSVSPVDNSVQTIPLDDRKRSIRKAASVEIDGETPADTSEWKSSRPKTVTNDWDDSRPTTPQHDPFYYDDDSRTHPYG